MRFPFLLACALALVPLPALADPVTDDLHCYMVSMQMQQSPDAQTKNAGLLSSFYWEGRLDGRNPKLDLKKRIVAETAALTDAGTFKAEARRCAAEMQARAARTMAVGQDLQTQAQQH